MARRSRVEGAASARSVMRRLPAAAQQEIASAMERGVRRILAVMIRKASRRTGATRRALKYKMSRNGLSARVGLIGLKAGRNGLFYARIQDLGRRAQAVKVRRRGSRPYVMRVRGMTARRFVTGSYGEFRKAIGDELKSLWPRILARIGKGNG